MHLLTKNRKMIKWYFLNWMVLIHFKKLILNKQRVDIVKHLSFKFNVLPVEESGVGELWWRSNWRKVRNVCQPTSSDRFLKRKTFLGLKKKKNNKTFSVKKTILRLLEKSVEWRYESNSFLQNSFQEATKTEISYFLQRSL